MNLKQSKTSNTLVGVHISNMDNPDFLHECFYSLALQNHGVDVLITHSGLNSDQKAELLGIAENPIVRIRTKNDDGEIKIIEEGAGNSMNFSIEEIEAQNFADVFNHLFQSGKNNGYEVISLIEYDDILSRRWFELVEHWRKENPSVGVFSPIIEQTINGVFANYVNEACWADGIAEEAGKYDNNLLLRFNSALIPLGAAFVIDNILSEEDIVEEDDGKLLPMKRSIKLFSYHEFLIRLTYNDIKIMNVPRVGYNMRIIQKDSYDERSCKIPVNLLQLPKEKGGLSQEEAQFWAKYATDSYFLESDDPSVSFTPQEQSTANV